MATSKNERLKTVRGVLGGAVFLLALGAPACQAIAGLEDKAGLLGSQDAATADGSANASAGNGACAATCAPPPRNACIDGKTLQAFVHDATCPEGLCTYASYNVICETACKDGACTGNDRCNGVACVTPPAPSCIDDTTLLTYPQSGTCSAGTCSYDHGTVPCDQGCSGGMCIGDPCAGVSCETPPAPTCANPTTLRAYGGSSGSSCSGGVCAYGHEDTPCVAPANADPTCALGACGFSCHVGYAPSGGGCALVHNSWSTVASLSTQRYGLAAVSGTDGRIYAMGGNDGVDGHGLLTSVEVYDPAARAWTTAASMATGREAFGAAVGADGRIYAVGGIGTPHYLDSVEAYSPTSNAWSFVASMPTARGELAVTADAAGRIYAMGGITESGSILATVEVYTPSTNTWATAASMLAPRLSFGAGLGADGRIYVVGGGNNQGNLATVDAYSPATNTWTTIGSDYRTASDVGAAIGPGGTLYWFGGESAGDNLAHANGLDTTSAQFDLPLPDMPTARHGLAAAAGGDGRVYAIGGFGAAYLTTVEAYYP